MIKMLEDMIRSAKQNNRQEIVLTISEMEQIIRALQEKEKPASSSSEFRATKS